MSQTRMDYLNNRISKLYTKLDAEKDEEVQDKILARIESLEAQVRKYVHVYVASF